MAGGSDLAGSILAGLRAAFGVLREPFETYGKQKLLVALAIIRVADSINEWINADGGEEEKCC